MTQNGNYPKPNGFGFEFIKMLFMAATIPFKMTVDLFRLWFAHQRDLIEVNKLNTKQDDK